MVLTQQTARPILLFCLRNKIPFVGLSSSWVRAGALYALDRDYADIGAHCAETALKLPDGAPVSSIPPAPPRKVVYAVNIRVASLLKIDLAPAIVAGARDVVR
jgi:putative ABC transport system substrate-binding protein